MQGESHRLAARRVRNGCRIRYDGNIGAHIAGAGLFVEPGWWHGPGDFIGGGKLRRLRVGPIAVGVEQHHGLRQGMQGNLDQVHGKARVCRFHVLHDTRLGHRHAVVAQPPKEYAQEREILPRLPRHQRTDVQETGERAEGTVEKTQPGWIAQRDRAVADRIGHVH